MIKTSKLDEALKTAERGDILPDGSIFLGWRAVEERSQGAVECPKCNGFSEPVDCTKEEIRSDLNCGRSWSCCSMAFKCKGCGARLVGHRPAPEME